MLISNQSTFFLSNGQYKAYMKPNNTPLYVNSQSNHPKKVLENIPLAVNERLNRISSNKSVFDAATPPYQEALRKSGYKEKMLIKADKTTNHYKMEKADYEEYVNRNITKDYKKATNDDFKKVTKEDKAIANKLEIADRVYTTSKREAFIT